MYFFVLEKRHTLPECCGVGGRTLVLLPFSSLEKLSTPSLPGLRLVVDCTCFHSQRMLRPADVSIKTSLLLSTLLGRGRFGGVRQRHTPRSEERLGMGKPRPRWWRLAHR